MGMTEKLSDLADELDEARERESEVRTRLKAAVLAHAANGMPTSQIISESRLARQTVYDWLRPKGSDR